VTAADVAHGNFERKDENERKNTHCGLSTTMRPNKNNPVFLVTSCNLNRVRG
jgi:hypothetical protein